MTAQRLFTQAEFDALCLPATERVFAALDGSDKKHTKAVYTDVEKAFREFHDIYHRWAATVLEFLFEHYAMVEMKQP
ncbi:MAG: hypothetical protein HYZ72_05100 [Deltaproteobacteria bacterium]|nr:hypothetical protein [Deltaproteobacteria bacterium]